MRACALNVALGQPTLKAERIGSRLCPRAARRCSLDRPAGARRAQRPQPLRAAADTQAQAPPQAPPETRYPATVEALPVGEAVTLLRISCSERLPEIEYARRRGSTTNSYLIKNSSGEHETLVASLPVRSFDVDFLGALRATGALRTLHHVVVSRLTPERLPALVALLGAAEQRLTLVAGNPALQLLKSRAESDTELAALLERVDLVAATRGTRLRLVGGRELSFVPVPTPRWPDMVAAYLESEAMLFSGNFFSARVAAPARGASPYDEGGWGAYGDDWRYYFDCMLAPAAKQATVALERLSINAVPSSRPTGLLGALLRPLGALGAAVSGLTLGADDGQAAALVVEVVCPAHGPVVRSALTELVRRYGEWTAAQVQAAGRASVAVLYASAYGNTAGLAQAISRGVIKAGVGVETLNLEDASLAEVESALERSAGFVIGSPTLGGHMPTQVQTALGAILQSATARQVPCGVFGSFGWSGEAIDMLEGKLKDAGYQLAFDPVRCKFKPTQATLQVCEESGLDLAQEVKRRLRRKERAAAEKLSVAESAPAAAQAVGRVLGSLCVLTARDGDAESAMLASWVSQASFDPPGLTVAVKKDRAVEGLLLDGAKFVLNVLAENKEKAIMKQMLKPFKPAEDRFAGVEVLRAEASGAAILPDAAAYLECSVSARMEAGDHYLIYATVDGGRVLDDTAPSSVHYRKVGTSY